MTTTMKKEDTGMKIYKGIPEKKTYDRLDMAKSYDRGGMSVIHMILQAIDKGYDVDTIKESLMMLEIDIRVKGDMLK